MRSKIVYLHGWGSSPQSNTAQALAASFPDDIFVCPQLDHTINPLVIRKMMEDLAGELLREADPILIGSSAGGFWADYLGSKYGIKTVLINPSLIPDTNFRKYDLPEKYYVYYQWIRESTEGFNRDHVVAFSGENDDVVPLEQVQTRYQNPIILVNEGHRIQNVEPIVDMIRNVIGNYPERQNAELC